MRDPVRATVDAVASAFTELPLPREPTESGVDGPIGWYGYDGARELAGERTSERESVVCGVGKVGDVEAVLVAFEFGFLGGSIGGRTGLAIEAAFTRARELGAPVVSLIATGGSRMQEGMRALTQLQRLARASASLRQAGLPHVAVLLDPATGGGWATLGAGADVTLAVPGAQVGFAGSRVRPRSSEGSDVDMRAYTAEGQFAAGHVDQLVDVAELPVRLQRWLRLLTSPAAGPVEPPHSLGTMSPPRSGWAAVTLARARQRPRAQSYLDVHFEWRESVSGDRCGGVDAGVTCGFGWRDGAAVAYAAQCGVPTSPAGFRTAARLVRCADRFGVPVLTLVDTVGAANDAAAERGGVGPAIADMFAAVAAATVPVTTLVIGEGGSGGALAFAARDRLWMTPDSYFSVTSPEAATAILKRGDDEIPAIADQLRLRPQDVVALGVAQGIVGPAR